MTIEKLKLFFSELIAHFFNGDLVMDKLIIYLIGTFFIIGAADYLFGNKLGLGVKFEEGIKAMGGLAIGMIGIYSLSPIISKILMKFLYPISNYCGFDSSIFPASFLAIDMGGYNMSVQLAGSKKMGLFSGIIIASSMGATLSFSIPIALGMISKEDEAYFSKGTMIGIITIPVGCFVAGLLCKLNLVLLIWNLLPLIIFDIILTYLLLKCTKTAMKVFNIFGRLIMLLSIVGLAVEGVNSIFGITFIKGLAPLSESSIIVLRIALVLAGAYTMLEVINKIFKTKLKVIANRYDLDIISILALIGNLASNLLVFSNLNKMNPKGKLICTAFAISGAFVFGGQLGFVSAMAPNMILPFVTSKLVSGIISIFAAAALYRYNKI